MATVNEEYYVLQRTRNETNVDYLQSASANYNSFTSDYELAMHYPTSGMCSAFKDWCVLSDGVSMYDVVHVQVTLETVVLEAVE